MAGGGPDAEVHPTIQGRFPTVEVFGKLNILKRIILERHPIIIPLLLCTVCRLIFLDFLCPVVGLFNYFKFDGRLGIFNLIQLDFTKEEPNFFIGVIVQPFDSGPVFLSGVFHNPDNDICRFSGGICNEFSQVVMVCIFQLVFDDDFSVCARFRCKNVHIEITNCRFCFINRNIKTDCICKERYIVIL